MPISDLNFLFDDNPNAMWIFELSTLKVLKVNKAAINRYGYSEKEFLNMTTLELRPEAEKQKFSNYLIENKITLAEHQGLLNNGTWKHQHKNGRIIYAEITSHNIRYHDADCRVVVANDVTEKMRLEEEARLREKFLNSLIDSQTNFLIRLNADGFFTFVNQQFLKVFGYKMSEIVGAHFSITIVPEEYGLCVKAFYDCINNPGKVIHLTHKKKEKKGRIHDTKWEFISITNDDGEISEIQGVGQDITHEHSVEMEIKEAAERMDTFIESITDSFFIVDKKWRFVKVNTAFEKVCRKSREEILGHKLWDIFPRIQSTAFEAAYRKAATENIRIQFSAYFEPFNRWFNTTVYPSAEGLAVFVKDISEEKRAQEELIWTKNNLEGLINNTEDQIWSIDAETRYVYMNQAYRTQIARLTGVEPKEGDFSNKHTGYTPEIIKRWEYYYSRAFSGEIYNIINESIDPLTKEVLSFEISFNPIYQLNGIITGIGCFARDITQRLKTEKAIVDQNERLRNIASLTSHELRRPVASMLGLINIMDRKNFFNPDNREIIEHLLTVGNEIDEVIRLIVDKTFTEEFPGKKYQLP